MVQLGTWPSSGFLRATSLILSGLRLFHAFPMELNTVQLPICLRPRAFGHGQATENAALSAFAAGGRWEGALALLSEMKEPDDISCPDGSGVSKLAGTWRPSVQASVTCVERRPHLVKSLVTQVPVDVSINGCWPCISFNAVEVEAAHFHPFSRPEATAR